MKQDEIREIAADFAQAASALGLVSKGHDIVRYVDELLTVKRPNDETLANLPELMWYVGAALRDAAQAAK